MPGHEQRGAKLHYENNSHMHYCFVCQSYALLFEPKCSRSTSDRVLVFYDFLENVRTITERLLIEKHHSRREFVFVFCRAWATNRLMVFVKEDPLRRLSVDWLLPEPVLPSELSIDVVKNRRQSTAGEWGG